MKKIFLSLALLAGVGRLSAEILDRETVLGDYRSYMAYFSNPENRHLSGKKYEELQQAHPAYVMLQVYLENPNFGGRDTNKEIRKNRLETAIHILKTGHFWGISSDKKANKTERRMVYYLLRNREEQSPFGEIEIDSSSKPQLKTHQETLNRYSRFMDVMARILREKAAIAAGGEVSSKEVVDKLLQDHADTVDFLYNLLSPKRTRDETWLVYYNNDSKELWLKDVLNGVATRLGVQLNYYGYDFGNPEGAAGGGALED